MPNLIRTPSMSSVPSIPCLVSPINPSSQGPSSLPTISSLRSSQSFDSSNGLTRLQSSSKTLFLQSVNHCLQLIFKQMYSFGFWKSCHDRCLIRILMLDLFPLSPWCLSVPSPGQLSQRVQSVGNFPTTPRHPLKATAYVSPTVQQGPSPTSLSTSVSLHSIPSSAALAQPIKASSTLVPQNMKANMNPSAVPRSSLPRPASFVGTSGLPRASKITQPTRRWDQKTEDWSVWYYLFLIKWTVFLNLNPK